MTRFHFIYRLCKYRKTMQIVLNKNQVNYKKHEGDNEMKNFMVSLIVTILTAGILSFSAISTEAKQLDSFAPFFPGDQDFLLVNNTGVEIYALYVTPHNADEWGDDILGVDTLLAGESVEINFSRKEKAKYWDLRVEDEDGAFIEWESLNLLKILTVKLYYKNGKATASVE